MEYTNEWLQQQVEELSLQRFGKPFKHQAYFYTRLQTTGGLYYHQSHNIAINPKILQKYDYDELVGVIIHELCHYHLHLEGKGYQHRDSEFKQLLAQTKGSRYVKPLQDFKYHYKCQACRADYYRYRRMNLNKYCCGKCQQQLFLYTELEGNLDD